ncbi:MAG: A24 family peptidase [Moraxella sp.]|nr:A24 family peptidase [Moraxella sp.]
MNTLELLQNTPMLTIALTSLLGLCVGSFLNVVIHRTPLIMHLEHQKYGAEYWTSETTLAQPHKDALLQYVKDQPALSLSFPPSRCPNCTHQIRWYENIPVLSWLVLQGKCSNCRTPISPRYPIVELITAVLSAVVIAIFGATLAGGAALILVWLLIALTGIDFDTQLLPDRLVYPLGMLGAAVNSINTFTSLNSAVWGGLLGFLVLWSVTQLYALLFKKQGMGAGDFKLLGALGLWLGVGMLPLMVLISSVLGSVVGVILMRRHGESRPFAFGPYIAIAGIIALLWGQTILDWYLNLYPANL